MKNYSSDYKLYPLKENRYKLVNLLFDQAKAIMRAPKNNLLNDTSFDEVQTTPDNPVKLAITYYVEGHVGSTEVKSN